MAALLSPFGNCVDVLNAPVVSPILLEGIKKAVSYVKNLEDADFKDKVSISLANPSACSEEVTCFYWWDAHHDAEPIIIVCAIYNSLHWNIFYLPNFFQNNH